jgi:hypothetical protein
MGILCRIGWEDKTRGRGGYRITDLLIGLVISYELLETARILCLSVLLLVLLLYLSLSVLFTFLNVLLYILISVRFQVCSINRGNESKSPG